MHEEMFLQGAEVKALYSVEPYAPRKQEINLVRNSTIKFENNCFSEIQCSDWIVYLIFLVL